MQFKRNPNWQLQRLRKLTDAKNEEIREQTAILLGRLKGSME